jgi:murein DD-endopeptidase MepM/ murein hydrolase activator NlpD
MKTKFYLIAILIVAMATQNLSGQTVQISTKAIFYGESLTVNWSGFSGPVNVTLKNGNEFIAYAATNVAGSGKQTLRMTNEDIGTGYQLQPGTEYYVLVELRSNTSIKKQSEKFSVSIPEVRVEPSQLEYGEKATLTWNGFASNINLIFTKNGEKIADANIDQPGSSGQQELVMTDEAVGKTGYQLTTGNDYRIKVQLRSEPSKSFYSNAFSVHRTFDFNISPITNSVKETAGNGQVMIYCNDTWSAYCNQSWIYLTSDKTGTGNGVLTYQFDENPNTSPRSAVITVTSDTTSRYLNITQSGKAITLNVNPSIVHSESNGGSFSVDVQANASWTASCTSNWINIQSGNNGFTDGFIQFLINENTSPDSRTAHIEVTAGNYLKQTIAVYQNGEEAIEKAVGFDNDEISNIMWPFAQGSYAAKNNWVITQGAGATGSYHHLSDYYAQDWSRGNCPDSTFFSPFSGIILYTGYDSGYGNHVVIQSTEDPEFAFRVAHLHEINVSAGQNVEAKQKLGKIGTTGYSTGFHAHCVLYKNISAEFSPGVSGIERLKSGKSLGVDQSGAANRFATDFVFDATYENKIGGGGTPVDASDYGFDVNGKFFLAQNAIESFQYEKVSVGFWNYSEKKYQESEMILNGENYEFHSNDSYNGARDFVFILYTNNGKKYLPHLIYNRLVKKEDAVENDSGGYNFHLFPTIHSTDPKEIKDFISAELYGFTGEGVFFIHDSIINLLGAMSVKVGFWNYTNQLWMEKPMSKEDDFWEFESFDSYYDYRDYLFIAETENGTTYLPLEIKDHVAKTNIRSNGYDGWNFYTKAKDSLTNQSTVKIGQESYGFTIEGEFWLSNSIVENIFGVTQVELGFWSYSENRWMIETMEPHENLYLFHSNDYYDNYRDYLFYVTTPEGILTIPAFIINQLDVVADAKSNGTGGYNFYTLPQDKPIDTKSVMITNSIPTATIENTKPKIRIYPNPVQDKLHIESNGNQFSAFEIMNIMGKVIVQNELNENIISLDGLSSGIYILRLKSSNGSISNTKFIKK